MSDINTINCKSPSFGLRDLNRKQKNVFKNYLLFCCMLVFLEFFQGFFSAFELSLTVNSQSIKKIQFLLKKNL